MPVTWINPFPVFNPLDLSPVLWLDAADTSTITASSGAVSQWDDKSGNGYHVSQSTGANQPTTGTVTKNGLNVLDFDGSTDTLSRTTDTALGQNVSGTTIYAVADWDTNVGGRIIAYSTPTDTTVRSQLFMNTSTQMQFNGRTLDANTIATVNSGTLATTTWYAVGVVVDYANTDVFIYINGTQDGSNTSYQTQTTTSNTVSSFLTIGNALSLNNHLDGQIAEILVFHSAHSATTRETMFNYLSRKWGL